MKERMATMLFERPLISCKNAFLNDLLEVTYDDRQTVDEYFWDLDDKIGFWTSIHYNILLPKLNEYEFNDI